jgi:hypothetical protein
VHCIVNTSIGMQPCIHQVNMMLDCCLCWLQLLTAMVSDTPGAWCSRTTSIDWLTNFPADPLPGVPLLRRCTGLLRRAVASVGWVAWQVGTTR